MANDEEEEEGQLKNMGEKKGFNYWPISNEF